MDDQLTIPDKDDFENIGYFRMSEGGRAVVLTDGKGNRVGVVNVIYLKAVIEGEQEYTALRRPIGEQPITIG